jgi:hypothetical protein
MIRQRVICRGQIFWFLCRVVNRQLRLVTQISWRLDSFLENESEPAPDKSSGTKSVFGMPHYLAWPPRLWRAPRFVLENESGPAPARVVRHKINIWHAPRQRAIAHVLPDRW